ncbi:hypothetical protein [Pelomonas sp. KK5]|uniref:hypothetical protein n=1 Tax=Pelomonas sp. KK5 TaxID=1855730 RepID=UPI00097CBA08|nr:hypothetical protein [Pelomonas sp. KK5]
MPVFSEAPPSETGRQGFVQEAVLADHPILSAHEVYACGKPLMGDTARSAFRDRAGLADHRFFSDAFVFRPVA